METVCFTAMLLSICESTRRHNPEEQRHHVHNDELYILKSSMDLDYEVGGARGGGGVLLYGHC
jgi:hypothetical protein